MAGGGQGEEASGSFIGIGSESTSFPGGNFSSANGDEGAYNGSFAE